MFPRLPLLLALPGLLAAQTTADLRDRDRADQVFAQWNSTHSPGCAVGVMRGGKLLFTRAYGMADLETGTPNTPETIFESGSVAKQFTATAVVLLAIDGRLDLDDPVRKYLPELPDYGRPLTIRHLLNHTSGIRDWSALVAAQGWERGTRTYNQADMLDLVFRQKALNHAPGQYYSYTNSGYALLAEIVQRVSGQPLNQFMTARIFTPLGMTHTRWRDDYTRVTPGRAQAYTGTPDNWHLQMPFENVIGPGGLLTTVGDLLLWNESLTNRTLGSAVVDSLSRRGRLNNGTEIEYALGLTFTTYRGVPEISHTGSTAGYRTVLARYPTRGNLSVAMLCNLSQSPGAHDLVDSLITDWPVQAPPDTVPTNRAVLARYAGIYRNERYHAAYEVDDRELSQYYLLRDGWYWYEDDGTRIHFDVGPNGKPTGSRAIEGAADTVMYTYVAERLWRPTTQELRQYEGNYRSEEIGTTWTVKLAGDTLAISPRPGQARKIRPVYQDGFGGNGAVWFTRDARGRVAAMHFGQARMWDLVLGRVP